MIEKPMKNWKGRETLGELKINKRIFQGDSLSPILFVITLIPLAILLRDVKAGYMSGWGGGGKKSITYSLWMISSSMVKEEKAKKCEKENQNLLIERKGNY